MCKSWSLQVRRHILFHLRDCAAYNAVCITLVDTRYIHPCTDNFTYYFCASVNVLKYTLCFKKTSCFVALSYVGLRLSHRRRIRPSACSSHAECDKTIDHTWIMRFYHQLTQGL